MIINENTNKKLKDYDREKDNVGTDKKNNGENDYITLKRMYPHYESFKEINSAEHADLIKRLKESQIDYEEYIHKSNNGCTVFYDNDINAKNLKSGNTQSLLNKINKKYYVIYAKGTEKGYRALFAKKNSGALYSYESEADVFDEEEMKKLLSKAKNGYNWIAKEVPVPRNKK